MTMVLHPGLILRVIFFLPSVPAAVNHLKASNRNTTDSLWFSWSPASGDFDFYELILYNPNGTKKENWRDKGLTEWRFQGLVPGRKYTLYVVTHSGALSNKVTGEGRTGKKPSQVLVRSDFYRCISTMILMIRWLGGIKYLLLKEEE